MILHVHVLLSLVVVPSDVVNSRYRLEPVSTKTWRVVYFPMLPIINTLVLEVVNFVQHATG
jgi:hypothetical protein